VDFHISPDEKSDIAFHFRVYFGRLVVMNTRQSGKWENEVKSSTMPFEDGKPFDLHLLVLHNEYQVSDPGNGPYSASMGSQRRTLLTWPGCKSPVESIFQKYWLLVPEHLLLITILSSFPKSEQGQGQGQLTGNLT
jgi:hypothetical protein